TTRLGAGDDDGIEIAIPEIVEIKVEGSQMRLTALTPRNTWQGIKLDVDGSPARCLVQQFEKLHFGVLEGGVGHIVHEPYLERFSGVAVDRHYRLRTLSFCPARRDPTTLNHYSHDKASGANTNELILIWPRSPWPALDRRRYRRSGRSEHSGESSPGSPR